MCKHTYIWDEIQSKRMVVGLMRQAIKVYIIIKCIHAYIRIQIPT